MRLGRFFILFGLCVFLASILQNGVRRSSRRSTYGKRVTASSRGPLHSRLALTSTERSLPASLERFPAQVRTLPPAHLPDLPPTGCEGETGMPAFCACVGRVKDDVRRALGGIFTLSRARMGRVGFMLHVYTHHDIVSHSIKNWGMWEKGISRELLQAMDEHYNRLKAKNPKVEKKDVKFLDIGTNVGWYSVLMGMHGYGVISVEPMMTNLMGLKNSVCENGLQDLVTVHETALAGEAKLCKLVSSPSNVGDGRMACDMEDGWVSGGDKAGLDGGNPEYVVRQDVRFSRLDDIVSDAEWIGAVKLDVEGFEPHVLAGGQETLLKGGIPKILSEFSPSMMKDSKADPIWYLQSFHDAGYDVRKSGFDSGRIISSRKGFEKLKNDIEGGGTIYFQKRV